MLLAVLAAPAFAVQQLDEISPLLDEPSLSFEPADIAAGWGVEGQDRRGAYRRGTTKVEGMTGPEVLVVAANPGATGMGGMARNAPSITPWQGKRVRLSARLASTDVEQLRMWLRVEGRDRRTHVRLYNMVDAPIRGTTGWKTYDIVMDVPRDAAALTYGFFIFGGKGKAFGEAFTLEEVGPEVAIGPRGGIDAWGTPFRRAGGGDGCRFDCYGYERNRW
jgi:hypothetical protein